MRSCSSVRSSTTPAIMTSRALAPSPPSSSAPTACEPGPRDVRAFYASKHPASRIILYVLQSAISLHR